MCYVRHGLEQSGKDYLTTLTGTQERLTWVAKDGTVLYDSVADPATMENHADRAEIRQAEQEGSGQSKHLSDTLLQKTLYYAVRLDDGTVLRLASVQTTMGVILLGVLQPVLVILILAIVISVLMASRLARQITKPINNIDLEDPRADETYEELFPLVSRLREQNRTIHQQMEALQRRQREFTALAENMNEGVLLLDGQYHILSSNQGAMRPAGAGGEAGGPARGLPPGNSRGRRPRPGRAPRPVPHGPGGAGHCRSSPTPSLPTARSPGPSSSWWT